MRVRCDEHVNISHLGMRVIRADHTFHAKRYRTVLVLLVVKLVCCYSFLVMCDARFFRPELLNPLMGNPEICFGLPPNFSEESVKEVAHFSSFRKCMRLNVGTYLPRTSLGRAKC